MYIDIIRFIYNITYHIHPAGWETARGGSMTSCKYLSTDLNTLTVVYACWENNLGSKSCYLQWGKILSNILVVNAILREGNILLEGLEFDSLFFAFLLKTWVSEQFRLPFCRSLFSGVFLAQVCLCRFFAKVCCSCVLPSPLPGSYIHVYFTVEFGCAFGTSRCTFRYRFFE